MQPILYQDKYIQDFPVDITNVKVFALQTALSIFTLHKLRGTQQRSCTVEYCTVPFLFLPNHRIGGLNLSQRLLANYFASHFKGLFEIQPVSLLGLLVHQDMSFPRIILIFPLFRSLFLSPCSSPSLPLGSPFFSYHRALLYHSMQKSTLSWRPTRQWCLWEGRLVQIAQGAMP